MIRKPIKNSFSTNLLVLLVILRLLSLCSSSSANGPFSLSPIKHFEASVAASSARGSVAAIRSNQDDEEYVVVVTLRPSAVNKIPQSSTQQNEKDKATERKFGLALFKEPLSSATSTQLGGSSICVMTGFAADIKHLTGVSLEQVESHQALYSHAMSVDRVVRAFSSTVQRAARSQGGRPYGVQALIVGIDSNGSFQLYTVDTTGGWQHYGGGATAVGRGAKEVRARLYKEMKNGTLTDNDGTVSEALRIAIVSLLGDSSKDDEKEKDVANKLEALLVWKSNHNSCCVRRIDDSVVKVCLKRMKDKE